MSTKTTNYQLTKLDSAEIGSMIDLNNNPEKLDAALKQNHDAQQNHIAAGNNPHNVTKEQVGLGKVDNTSDADKPISTAQQNALNRKADLTEDGKVPASQLSTGVLEFPSAMEFPAVGESGKLYVDLAANRIYRWSSAGTYIQLDSSSTQLLLGETADTAFRGDLGKAAYDHSQSAHARTDATKTEPSGTNGNIKIDGAEQKVYDDTELSNSIANLLDSETIAKASAAGIDVTTGQGVTNLNRVIRSLLENPVIEEYDDEESGWHVEKFMDGTARCKREYSYDNITVDFANVIERAKLPLPAAPFAFKKYTGRRVEQISETGPLHWFAAENGPADGTADIGTITLASVGTVEKLAGKLRIEIQGVVL